MAEKAEVDQDRDLFNTGRSGRGRAGRAVRVRHHVAVELADAAAVRAQADQLLGGRRHLHTGEDTVRVDRLEQRRLERAQAQEGTPLWPASRRRRQGGILRRGGLRRLVGKRREAGVRGVREKEGRRKQGLDVLVQGRLRGTGAFHYPHNQGQVWNLPLQLYIRIIPSCTQIQYIDNNGIIH